METPKVEISQSEWEVMRIVWTLGPLTSSTLATILAEKMGWKVATTKTFLGRLVKKGALTTEKNGREFLYHTVVGEQESMDAAVAELFSHLCQMKIGTAINHLMTNVNLSKHDIEMLQQTLLTKQHDAPETVSCNCLPEGCKEAAHE